MIKNSLMIVLGTQQIVEAVQTNINLQQKAEQIKNPASTMTDEDVKCYTERYPFDVNNTVDARSHFDTVGKEQGRLSTCARSLTQYESQKYLDRNPSLQRKFGRGGQGGPALQLANEHFMEIGFKDANFIKGRDESSEPWFCGATEYTNCGCEGTLWMGPKLRPDNNETIKSFDDMRQWKSIYKQVSDWTMCSSKDMGGDPWPGADKQCWCEPTPQYEPTPCGNEGDQCLCNGYVAYGVKQSPDDDTRSASVEEMTQVPFAINDANNTKSIVCSSSSFEMADPLPNGNKQCFCDEKKSFIENESVQYIKQYWRDSMIQMSMTVVLETATSIESKAESQISIVETSTASKETQEMEEEKSDGGPCATCEIEKAKAQEAKEKQKLETERLEREKAEAIEKEKAERERQESIRRKREAEQLKAAAEAAENARQKQMLEEESRRMKAEADRLEAIAQIERERIIREQEIARQTEIRRLQMITIERRKREQIAIERQRQEEIVIQQRRAEIQRQRVIQEQKLIAQKVEAEIVKQKSVVQMEQSLIQSQTTITREYEMARKRQRRVERRMRHQHRGTMKLEDIAQQEVTAVVKKYEYEKQVINKKMSIEYAKLNTIKEEQQVIIQKKTKEAAQHRRIKEEAQNATIVLKRRISEVQKSLTTVPACGPGSSQGAQLENELKQIQSEINTNTKIAELESKSESKDMKEADAANTQIFNEEKIVNSMVEEVSLINDKTEYAEAQKDVILEQKTEEKLEGETVLVEVEAFKANQTSLSEQSTLRQMASYSQQRVMSYNQGYGNFQKKKAGMNKQNGLKASAIAKMQRDVANMKGEQKEQVTKQIIRMQTEIDGDNKALAAEEEEWKITEKQKNETVEATKKQEEVYMAAEKKAAEFELKVQASQDNIIKNCQKQTKSKRDASIAADKKFEEEKKKLEETIKTEKEVQGKSQNALTASDKVILEQKQELNKLSAQKRKLIDQRGAMTTVPEKKEVDAQIQTLDSQAMSIMQTIDTEVSKKKVEGKNLATSHERVNAQQMKVKAEAHAAKTIKEMAAFAEMSCMSSTSIMISTSKAANLMTSSSQTSTTTREYSNRVHRRIKELRDVAHEKRSVSQQAYTQFKQEFPIIKSKAVEIKKAVDGLTMTLEEYKSAIDMFMMKLQELGTRMKSTSNDTIKAQYQGEIEILKKEREETIKLIEQDKKDRKVQVENLKKIREEIVKMRTHVKNLRLEAKKAEDKVTQAIMAQTGPESLCEKKKIQAQQKQVEAEKNAKQLEKDRDTIQEQINQKQLKLAAHELNQKESEEVIQSLMKRKASTEADASVGNQEQIINTIKAEIETETGRANEEKKAKEDLAAEIKKLTEKIANDERKSKTSKEESKKAIDEAIESCDEDKDSGSGTLQEEAFKQEAVAKDEQKLALEDEIAEMKLIQESTKASETSTMTRIETEINAAEGKQTEAETVIDALYKEIKDSQAKMAAGAKAPEIVQMQADIAAREKKIDDQKDIVRVAMEEKRKAEQEKKLIEESMKEQLDEIANMTAQVTIITKETEGAKQQAIDYKAAQAKIDEQKVKKMAKEEVANQKKIARLEKQLEDNKNKTESIKEEQIKTMQSLPAAEHAYALAQKQATKTQEDSLITTCTKLYVEKRELFTAADKAMQSGKGQCDQPVQSCLGCGTGSTGVTQVTVQINNKGLIDSLIDGLFAKTLVADIEEVIASKKTSSVGGEKKTTSAPSGVKLVMTTSDDRVQELLALITEWSNSNDNASGDVIATPFKYGKQDYFDFVKEATKKKEVDFEAGRKAQSAVQLTTPIPQSFDTSTDNLPYSFNYLQTGANGVVSQLLKNKINQ